VVPLRSLSGSWQRDIREEGRDQEYEGNDTKAARSTRLTKRLNGLFIVGNGHQAPFAPQTRRHTRPNPTMMRDVYTGKRCH